MTGYMIHNRSVREMVSINITGNVIPMEWFRHIRFKNGKPNTCAIMLLSDIVYWYRPNEIRDEVTGQVTGYLQKFKADKLQKSYDQLASTFGYTKEQVRDAIHQLSDFGVIDLEFRNFSVNGLKLTNVLFIGLDVARLIEITFPSVITSPPPEDQDTRPIGIEVDTYPPEEIGIGIDVDTLPTSIPTGPGTEVDTNTENTTENTTESLFGADAPTTSGCPKSSPDFPQSSSGSTGSKTEKKSKARTGDERSKHPAILLIKGITGKYPPLELYDDLIQVLGQSPDGPKLAGCRREWLARGYNPTSWKWVFDWYVSGIPQNGNGHNKRQKPKDDGLRGPEHPLTQDEAVRIMEDYWRANGISPSEDYVWYTQPQPQ